MHMGIGDVMDYILLATYEIKSSVGEFELNVFSAEDGSNHKGVVSGFLGTFSSSMSQGAEAPIINNAPIDEYEINADDINILIDATKEHVLTFGGKVKSIKEAE